ncbi:MAG TPA: HlyD family efflux transporter periplasmic adaptor subunit [Methylomirabilota bacterium]|nr:HlyD family efflux transporter periplasmic adaptor subunit [Methylomirabilota bacterium]
MNTVVSPAPANARAKTAPPRPPHRPQGTRLPRRRTLLGWLAGLALLTALLLALRPSPITVELGTVGRGPLTVSVLEEGKTRIRHRYVISPPLAGLLRRPALRAGDRLEAGQTVVATLETQPAGFLDPRARAQAEAAVAAAEAALNARLAEVERARAAVDLMIKERRRAKELQAGGAVSVQEWDRVDAEATVRERELRATEFAARVAEFELIQARAALLQAQQAVDGTNTLFEIRSPVTGVVLNVFEESARIVTPGTPLMEVGDPRDLEIEVELLSQDAVGVRPGAELWIERWGGEKPLRGRVSVIEPAAFTKISALGVEEQRVRVRADFVDQPPADQPLGDRFRIEARVVTWHADDVLRIPTGALFRRGGEWMTFVVSGNVARLRKVTIGHNSGVYAEVLDGVRANETVIVHPPDIVADGGKIRARRSNGA